MVLPNNRGWVFSKYPPIAHGRDPPSQGWNDTAPQTINNMSFAGATVSNFVGGLPPPRFSFDSSAHVPGESEEYAISTDRGGGVFQIDVTDIHFAGAIPACGPYGHEQQLKFSFGPSASFANLDLSTSEATPGTEKNELQELSGLINALKVNPAIKRLMNVALNDDKSSAAVPTPATSVSSAQGTFSNPTCQQCVLYALRFLELTLTSVPGFSYGGAPASVAWGKQ
jgi:hypothetical protein